MFPSNDHRPARSGFTLLELVIVMSLLAVISTAVFSAYLFMGRNLERLAKTQQQDVKARRALFQFTQDVSSAISFSNAITPNLTSTTNLTFTVPTILTLSNCATTTGNTTVTCTSTAGLASAMALSSVSAGIPANTTVSSVTNATKFVMSNPASATGTGMTISVTGTPAPMTYLYTSSSLGGTLTRIASSGTTTILTDIDSAHDTGATPLLSPTNGFIYYNESGTVVTSLASVKAIEFSFTTKVGNAKIGTQASYVIVSPRVVVRNKPFLP